MPDPNDAYEEPWDVLDEMEYGGGYGRKGSGCGKEIPDVTAIRETAAGLLVRIGGTNIQRWLPKKAIQPGSEVHNLGDVGSLHIHSWLAKKWEEGDVLSESVADGPIAFENCVCLSASAKAVLVSMEDGKELWFPRNQIDPTSEIKDDSDAGTLVVSRWIAKQKGLVE